MKIGEYIKTLRLNKGLSQEELGRIVGVQRAAVQKWETGTVTNLKRATIQKLADFFEVEPSSFIVENATLYDLIVKDKYIPSGSGIIDKNTLQNIIKPITTKKFPMLGEIACGKPIYAEQDYETFIEASAEIKADFCLTAKGDSMINARIFDGDIVFIRKQSDVDNGEIAAVIIGDEVTLKRVYKYENRIELRPENPTHNVLNYEGIELEQIYILGKAVAFQSYIR